MYPLIFHEFPRKESISDGCSIYDFLGGAIDASYKRGWEKNVLPPQTIVKPGYPAPSEWSADWIACLLAAKFAGDHFTVIELGAGYGQWMVTAIMAYRTLHPNRPVHGMALEADITHYQWLEQHVARNLGSYSGVHTDLVHAAAGYDGVVSFPILSEPDRDYGMAYKSNSTSDDLQQVPCLSMRAIDQRFAKQRVDILHIDIQGAEKDLIVSPGFDELIRKTRFVLFGTHRSNELHNSVKDALEASGMKVIIEWPRNSFVKTSFGDIQTNDGAILGINHNLFQEHAEYIRLISELTG